MMPSLRPQRRGNHRALARLSVSRSRACFGCRGTSCFRRRDDTRGVAALTERYETDPTLRQKISRFHRDPDGAFYAWSRAWLLPEFRGCTIVDEPAALSVPLLVNQGAANPFGSMAHARLIADRSGQTPPIVELAGCGHIPHTVAEAETLRLVTGFLTDRASEQVEKALK